MSVGERPDAGSPPTADRLGGGVSDTELAALDHEGVPDVHGAEAVAVAVPGEDDIGARAGCGQLQVLLETGVGQHHPRVSTVVVLLHHFVQRLCRVADAVAGALVGRDGVERLRAHHRRDSDPSSSDVPDAYAVEERHAAVVDRVGAHRHPPQPRLEVVRPPVVSGREQVVQGGEEFALDASLAEVVVAAPLEEVSAVHDQAVGPRSVEVGEHRSRRIEGGVNVGRRDDLTQLPVHGVTSQMSAPRACS